MDKHLQQLIEISRFYGSDKDYLIAGGGNTSFKDDNRIWVKASGYSLADISIDEFALLSRKKLMKLSAKTYSDDPGKRESQVKNDLYDCLIHTGIEKRPSVETSLHGLIHYKFVVHTHPTLVNALMCSRNAKSATREMFGDKVLFIPYIDPGFTLFKHIEERVLAYRRRYNKDPKTIFLQNHGLIVSSDSVREIKSIHREIITTLKTKTAGLPVRQSIPIQDTLLQILPAIRAKISGETYPVVRLSVNPLVLPYTRNKSEVAKISKPFTPDMVVYCRKEWIYIENSEDPKLLIEEFGKKLKQYLKRNHHAPKIIILKNIGVLGVESDSESVDTVLAHFEDLVKIRYYSDAFGGGKALTDAQIKFIDEWEVENYRRKVTKRSSFKNSRMSMVALVTGGGQGFGKGIADALFQEGVEVVIADVNARKGRELERHLNSQQNKNSALFVKTDISRVEEVKSLMIKTVTRYGGIDLLISNAGVLNAGSLDEMDLETFNLVTRINYTGYFICAKAASEILKIQHKFRPDKYSDIIQINSKSGLKGSNKNFAYAGSKFGGIGLTQSFALELIEFNIKVNAICPGNYFDGPLWSDPKKGLFVQYLKAGKVPGAKTVIDVKRYYENQVPMGRGCEIEDVMKAIWYVIDQKYETGQAIPVSGGQTMLK